MTVSPTARGFDVDATLWSRDCVLISRHNSTKTMAVMITRNSPAPLGLHRQPRRPLRESSTASLASRSASRLRSPLTRNWQQRLSVCDFEQTHTQRWQSVTDACLGAMAKPATSRLSVARVHDYPPELDHSEDIHVYVCMYVFIVRSSTPDSHSTHH